MHMHIIQYICWIYYLFKLHITCPYCYHVNLRMGIKPPGNFRIVDFVPFLLRNIHVFNPLSNLDNWNFLLRFTTILQQIYNSNFFISDKLNECSKVIYYHTNFIQQQEWKKFMEFLSTRKNCQQIVFSKVSDCSSLQTWRNYQLLNSLLGSHFTVIVLLNKNLFCQSFLNILTLTVYIISLNWRTEIDIYLSDFVIPI